MDWATIIVGVLAMVGTLIGSYFSNNKTTALVIYRLQQLEDKVNKHNNVIERMAIVENEVKDIKHDLDHLKTEKEK